MRVEETTVTATMLESKIRYIVAGKLQLDITEIPGHKTLSEIGFDSLGLSDLAEAIDEHFGVKAPDRTLPGAVTLDGLVKLVQGWCQPNGEFTDKWRTAEAAD